MTTIETQVLLKTLDSLSLKRPAGLKDIVIPEIDERTEYEAKLSFLGKIPNSVSMFYFPNQLKIMGQYQWQFHCTPSCLQFYRELKHMTTTRNHEDEWKELCKEPN